MEERESTPVLAKRYDRSPLHRVSNAEVIKRAKREIMLNDAFAETSDGKKGRATRSLRWAALFLGELRDGLTMVCHIRFRPSTCH